MNLLRENFKTKESVKRLINNLIVEVAEGKMFSTLDGFIIGLIYVNSGFITTLITTEHDLPSMSDNTFQQLSQCMVWLTRNEEMLVKNFAGNSYKRKAPKPSTPNTPPPKSHFKAGDHVYINGLFRRLEGVVQTVGDNKVYIKEKTETDSVSKAHDLKGIKWKKD